tara:strand:+ start:281 stop:784 length:504 start_codon:yes stop_codon:yes gene_type:complete
MENLKIIILFPMVFLVFNLSTYAQDSKNPKKAAIYSTVLPGLGQVYTKKYWKIPLIYAGLVTSYYYIDESYEMYSNYKNSYLDRLNGTYSDKYPYSNSQLVELTEYYRRNTELSVLCFALTYIINIVDASVSAHLFDYNVSEDLSLSIVPLSSNNQNIAAINLCLKL